MYPGTMNLASELPAAETSAAWADQPVYAWLLIAAALLVLFLLPELFKLIPSVSGCLIRSRGNLEVEHSISTARSRNQCARILLVPFVLAVSRYGLYTPAFLADWGHPWLQLGQILAVCAAYLILRRILHALLLNIRSLRLDYEDRRAITRGILNFFVLLMLGLLPTVCLLYAFGAGDSAARAVLLTEIALAWGFSVTREAQFLHSKCSGLGTFLYLCGLEFIPAACLVFSGICL